MLSQATARLVQWIKPTASVSILGGISFSASPASVFPCFPASLLPCLYVCLCTLYRLRSTCRGWVKRVGVERPPDPEASPAMCTARRWLTRLQSCRGTA